MLHVTTRDVCGGGWARPVFQLRQADVHTIVTLTDNAPQGLNQALSSSFVHATQVGTPSSVQLYKLSLINQS